jgi:hypothetical protein
MEDTDMWHGLDPAITEARNVADRSPRTFLAIIEEATGPISREVRGPQRRDRRS